MAQWDVAEWDVAEWSADDTERKPDMNWIAKVPDVLLYPVGWYLEATDWIEKHAHAAFWCGVALVIVAWWL
jgi:hypothetical protein